MSTLSVDWGGGEVSAAWDAPDAETVLVFGHGAGGSMHTPSLRAFATGLSAAGIGVVRFNFPYAEARKKAPDRRPALEACYRAVLARVGERAGTVFAGGRSMGGRIASHLAAAGEPIEGLVLHSYPLHPPGKPDRLRDEHLYALRCPVLLVQGTRDPFATPDLLARVVGRIPTVSWHPLEGGDHSLSVKGRAPEDVVAELVSVTAAWMRGHRA